MLRPVWLGLIFLFAVGGMAAARFAAPRAVANSPAPSKSLKHTDRFISPTEGLTTIGTTLPEQLVAEPLLTKTDRLAVVNAEPVSVKTVPVLVSPPRKPESETPKDFVKIVSRHWRDPLAPKLSSDKAAKSKSTKKAPKPLS